jgi:hypothetical protein
MVPANEVQPIYGRPDGIRPDILDEPYENAGRPGKKQMFSFRLTRLGG